MNIRFGLMIHRSPAEMARLPSISFCYFLYNFVPCVFCFTSYWHIACIGVAIWIIPLQNLQVPFSKFVIKNLPDLYSSLIETSITYAQDQHEDLNYTPNWLCSLALQTLLHIRKGVCFGVPELFFRCEIWETLFILGAISYFLVLL